MSSYFDFYRKVNDLSVEGRRSHWLYLDLTVLPHLPSLASAPRIIDVGCGAGILLEWLKARGYSDVHGVDTDAAQVAFARSLGLDASCAKDVSAWLSASPPADFIVLKDVLEHVPRSADRDLLRAIRDTLRAGGRMYVAVPNANASFSTRWRYIDATHLRSYTEYSLASDLESAGLAVTQIGGDDVWATRSLLGHCQQALRRVFRFVRRVEAAAEFGTYGWYMPLSLNLVAIAGRSTP